MKKSLLLLAVSLICLQFSSFSQKTRAGFMGGITLSSMTGELFGNENNYETKKGVTLGIMIDAPIAKSRFSFAPGLHYVQKGTLQRPPQGTLITKSYVSLRYVELNANFIYRAPGNKGNFYAGAGPSLSFKVPSKKGTMIDEDKTETDVNFGTTVDKDLRGMDYGLNVLIGYRLAGGFFVTANYNRGLRDLRPVPESAPEEVMNQYFGIQIGWLFANPQN
jgi:hypothetical protein